MKLFVRPTAGRSLTATRAIAKVDAPKLGRERSLAAYSRDSGGAAAVEFALLLPFLAFMSIGAIEVGLAMFAQHILESATFSASRLGKTGYTQAGNFDEVQRTAAMRAVINDRISPLLDSSKVSMTVKAYGGFSQIGQPEPYIDANKNGKRDNGENFTDVNGNGVWDSDQGASGMGAAKQVVVYTVSYPWQITTPFIGKNLLGDQNGVLNLTARAVVSNEPFS